MRKSALPCFSARSSQLWHGICHLRPLQRFVHAVWGDITWRRIWSSSYWRKQIARSAEIERSRPTDRIRGWRLWGVGGITHVWVGGHHVGKEFGVVGVRGTAAVTSWRLAHSTCDFCDGKDLSMFGFARNSGWDTRHALNIGRLIYERKINNNLFKLELMYTGFNIILGCYSSNMFSALRGIGLR